MQNISNTSCLVDTNILVYFLDEKSSFHPRASEVMAAMSKGIFEGYIAQQNIIECANTLLSQGKQEHGTVIRTVIELYESFDSRIIIPLDTTTLTFSDLLSDMPTRKKEIFDVFLAATMIDNGIQTIITNNDKDFTGIKGISVYNPWKE